MRIPFASLSVSTSKGGLRPVIWSGEAVRCHLLCKPPADGYPGSSHITEMVMRLPCGPASLRHRHTASEGRKATRTAVRVCKASSATAPRPLISLTGKRFPYSEPLRLKSGKTVSSFDVVQTFQPFVDEHRMERIRQVAAYRTFNVLPIVEGIYDMGNLSAICRSADALGIGALHMINSSQAQYKQSARQSGGAEKWLDVKVWKSSLECIDAAKENGFQVVVTHLAEDAVDIKDIDWRKPTAIVVGNEQTGVSEEVRQAADIFAVLPTFGMVQSLNVSVAAALMLNEARRGREAALGRHADLTEEEQACLRSALILKHQNRAEQMVTELLKRPPPQWQQRTRWYAKEVRLAQERQRDNESSKVNLRT